MTSDELVCLFCFGGALLVELYWLIFYANYYMESRKDEKEERRAMRSF